MIWKEKEIGYFQVPSADISKYAEGILEHIMKALDNMLLIIQNILQTFQIVLYTFQNMLKMVQNGMKTFQNMFDIPECAINIIKNTQYILEYAVDVPDWDKDIPE